MTIQSISTDKNTPLTLLDADVNAAATVRTNVWANGEGTRAMAIELVVTMLGATPVNLALRVNAQLTAPASESSTLLPVSVGVPDMSALAATYKRVFLLPALAPWMQLEFENVSGGNVHVAAYAFAVDAEYVAAAANAGHVVVDTLPSLPAGTAVIGHVIVDTLPSLAAGTAVIGHVIVDTLPSLPAGSNLVGKVSVPNPSTMHVGQATVGTTAAQYTASATPVTSMPILKADPSNTGVVYVGTSSGVTTANGFALAAGDAVPIPIDDLSKIWAIASVASQKYSVIAGL